MAAATLRTTSSLLLTLADWRGLTARNSCAACTWPLCSPAPVRTTMTRRGGGFDHDAAAGVYNRPDHRPCPGPWAPGAGGGATHGRSHGAQSQPGRGRRHHGHGSTATYGLLRHARVNAAVMAQAGFQGSGGYLQGRGRPGTAFWPHVRCLHGSPSRPRAYRVQALAGPGLLPDRHRHGPGAVPGFSQTRRRQRVAGGCLGHTTWPWSRPARPMRASPVSRAGSDPFTAVLRGPLRCWHGVIDYYDLRRPGGLLPRAYGPSWPRSSSMTTRPVTKAYPESPRVASSSFRRAGASPRWRPGWSIPRAILARPCPMLTSKTKTAGYLSEL